MTKFLLRFYFHKEKWQKTENKVCVDVYRNNLVMSSRKLMGERTITYDTYRDFSMHQLFNVISFMWHTLPFV